MNQLKCVSGGDSWCFELPFDLGTGGGIAKALFGTCLGVPFTNIAHPGDSSEESMGLGMSSKLRSVLPGADILLWSSGGDDFAGDGFRIYLHRNTGQPAVEAVNYEFLDAALTVTMNDYKRLVQIRDEVAPNCLIVCGCYDFPPASQMGHGFITYGPWLKPGLVDAGWTNPDDQEAIVKQFLLRLKKHISEFAAMSRKFLFVDCQGVCGAEDWANELHLNRGGCLKHGQVINAQLLPWLDIISTLSQPGGASDKAGQPTDAPASVTPPAPDYG